MCLCTCTSKMMGVGLARNTPGSRFRSVQNKDPNPLALAAPILNIWD